MFAKKKADRTCPKGHVLEKSWERCPYCEAERETRSPDAEPAGSEPDDESAGSGTTPASPVEMRGTTPRPVVVPRRVEAKGLPGGWLVALGGEQAGQDFRLGRGRNALGKASKCEVVLKDPHASERHALLEIREGGEAVLEDLGSKYGTFVNGERVAGRCMLHDGDRIRLGGTELAFRSFPPG